MLELTLDPALLTALAGQHMTRIAALTSLTSLQDAGDTTARTMVDLDERLAAATRNRSALQLCDGELVPLLRAAAGLAGHRLLLEDADFHIFHWSDEPSPPPKAFGALMTPARVARFAKTLMPGVPETVRLGMPAEGFRLVMRLGHRRPVGYLSVLNSAQTCPSQLQLLLQQLESPLVTAMRYEQGLLRLSHESRAQVLHDLFTDKFTAPEQLQAAAFPVGHRMSGGEWPTSCHGRSREPGRHGPTPSTSTCCG